MGARTKGFFFSSKFKSTAFFIPWLSLKGPEGRISVEKVNYPGKEINEVLIDSSYSIRGRGDIL